MRNHVGQISIFSLRTQDCRRLVSKGESGLLDLVISHTDQM
jgi:hypothetical protein